MTTATRARGGRWWRVARFLGGLGLAVLLLWLFLRRTSVAEVERSLVEASVPMLCAVLALNVASILLRAWRWQLLLQPLKPGISFGPVWRPYVASFAVTALLPGRVGEILRPLLFSRDQGVAFSSSLATVVTERVIDLTVVLAMLASGFVVPGALGRGAAASGAAVASIEIAGVVSLAAIVCGTAFLVALRLRTAWATGLVRRLLRPLPARLRDRVVSVVEAFAQGIGGLKSGAQVAALVGSTLVTWLVLIASYFLALRAFGITPPLGFLPFFVAVVALGVVVPTPGGTGTFHAAMIAVAGDLWGYGADHGGAVAACAIVTHLIAMLPVVVLGAWAWTQQGFDVLRAPLPAADQPNDPTT
jgi:glycosyltransferase 2 family protein